MTSVSKLIMLNQMAGPLFRQLAEGLAEQFPERSILITGHPDTLSLSEQMPKKLRLCSAPSYNRNTYLTRVLSWFSYVLFSTKYILSANKSDAIILVSNPPLLGPWVWFLTRFRSVPYVVLVYDIHPDVLVRFGILKNSNPITVIWRWMNRWVYGDASLVVTLGRRMAAALAVQVNATRSKIAVVPPWADVTFLKPLRRDHNPHCDKFLKSKKGLVVLYSGNMGASHDIDSMLKAALLLRDKKDIHFLFIGDGEKRGDVERFLEKHRLENISVFPFQPEAMLPYTLSLADVSLVALDEGMEDLMVPSKTYSYLSVGSAVIAITNENSGLQDIVDTSKCGYCVSPKKPTELSKLILKLSQNEDLRETFKSNARKAAEALYSRSSGVEEFVRVLGRVGIMPVQNLTKGRTMLNLKLANEERFLTETICHRDFLDKDLIRQLYSELGDEHLFQLCEKNRVTSIAADALALSDIKELPSRWRESYQAMENRIGEYLKELDAVAALLHLHKIPLVALKNSGISRALYNHYGSCPMGDVDVLVRKSDFRKAHQILIENGYVMKFRSPLEEENLDLAEIGGGAEYSVNLKSGEHLWFELQWRPVAGRWIRPEQEPSADVLIERSMVIKGSAARVLSPEDNLLQVALHTAKHTFVRAPGFRLHTDVDRIVREANINWDVFVQSVERLQIKTPVFFSLALAHDLLHTPVPEIVLSRISPTKIKIRLMIFWLQSVGLFDPDGKKWGRLGYIVFVSLLYDDITGLARGVFPRWSQMKAQHDEASPVKLLFLYLNRIFKLIFRRTLVK